MTSNDTPVQQLILNLIEDKTTFDNIKSSTGLVANELYLISNDNTDPVTSVNYVSASQKFVYTTEGNVTTDIITVSGIKSLLSLSNVASDGLYTSLLSKPQINGVELSGNKTTSDLGIVLNYTSDAITNKPSINNVPLTGNLTTSQLNINYGDLQNLPTIPTVTSNYVQGNTGAALTSAGVDQALTNYVPKTITVTGTGALGGGGQLNQNRTITHNSAPTGLTTLPVKIGVDAYGHVCTGSSITALDVIALPDSYNEVTSTGNLDLSYSLIVCTLTASENVSIDTSHKPLSKVTIFYINGGENSIDVGIPSALATSIFVNGSKISANHLISIPSGQAKKVELYYTQNNIFIEY